MNTLLAALERAVRPRQVRRATVALGIAAALAGGFGIAALSLGAEEPCAAIPERLVGVADAARRAEVPPRCSPPASRTRARWHGSVDAASSEYADAWARAAGENCEATRVVGDQASRCSTCARPASTVASPGSAPRSISCSRSTGSRRSARSTSSTGLEPLAPAPTASASAPPCRCRPTPTRARDSRSSRPSVTTPRRLRNAGRNKDALLLAEAARAGAEALGYSPALAGHGAAGLAPRARPRPAGERRRTPRRGHHRGRHRRPRRPAGRRLAGRGVDAERPRPERRHGHADPRRRGRTGAGPRDPAPGGSSSTPRSPTRTSARRRTTGRSPTTRLALALLDSPRSASSSAWTRLNRATLLVKTDGGELAESTLQAVLADIERVLGVGHPLTSNVHYLGNLAQKQGDIERALAEYEQARAIKADRVRPRSPGTMLTDERIAGARGARPRSPGAGAPRRPADALARPLRRPALDRQRILTNTIDLLLETGAVDLRSPRPARRWRSTAPSSARTTTTPRSSASTWPRCWWPAASTKALVEQPGPARSSSARSAPTTSASAITYSAAGWR